MKFETKFNKLDKVWYMKNNQPVEVLVKSINILVGTNQDTVYYTGEDVKNPVSWLDHNHLHENTTFASKKELLESL